CGSEQRHEPAIGVHQWRNRGRGDQAGNSSANGKFIGNDEMLEVDKGGGDDECNKNPISDRDLPRKRFPYDKKEKGSEQLNREIAKSDSRSAMSAASAQYQPANEW